MLELSLKLRPAIIRFAALDKKFPFNLEEYEWDALHTLMGFLKVFYAATLKLSGTKYPTLNLYFPEFCEVYLCIKKMEISSYPFVVQMSKGMFVKWNKYWSIGNTLLAIACVLDPRCKMMVIEYYYQKIFPEGCELIVSNVRLCMDKLLKEYLESHSMSVQRQQGESSSRYLPFFKFSINFFSS